jgi:hypothetical protein
MNTRIIRVLRINTFAKMRELDRASGDLLRGRRTEDHLSGGEVLSSRDAAARQ